MTSHTVDQRIVALPELACTVVVIEDRLGQRRKLATVERRIDLSEAD